MDAHNSADWIWIQPFSAAIQATVNEIRAFPAAMRSAIHILKGYITDSECRVCLQAIEQEVEQIIQHTSALLQFQHLPIPPSVPPRTVHASPGSTEEAASDTCLWPQPPTVMLLALVRGLRAATLHIRELLAQSPIACKDNVPPNVPKIFEIIERQNEGLIQFIDVVLAEALLSRIQQDYGAS
jgi:hypothetical protein